MRQMRIILTILVLGIVLTFVAHRTLRVEADFGPPHAEQSYPATWIGAQSPPALR